MSCSDKACRWAKRSGLQGAAAGNVLPRIGLASVTVLIDEDADVAPTTARLRRALCERCDSLLPPSCVARVAAVVARRPFSRTSEAAAQVQSNPACFAGHLSAPGGNASAQRIRGTSARWSIHRLTGKEGAPQGTTPSGRLALLKRGGELALGPTRSDGAAGGGAVSSIAIDSVDAESGSGPKLELAVCRRWVLRKTLLVTSKLGMLVAGAPLREALLQRQQLVDGSGGDAAALVASYGALKKSQRGICAPEARVRAGRAVLRLDARSNVAGSATQRVAGG